MFLVTCTRLYKPLCRSVRQLVGRSVGQKLIARSTQLMAIGLVICVLWLRVRNASKGIHPDFSFLFSALFSSTPSPPRPPGSDMDFRQVLTSLRTSLLTLDLSQNIFPPCHLDALCSAFERGRIPGDSGPPLSDLNLANTNVEEFHIKRLLNSCENLSTINLSGSRALPRDMKKLYQGEAFLELKRLMAMDGDD